MLSYPTILMALLISCAVPIPNATPEDTVATARTPPAYMLDFYSDADRHPAEPQSAGGGCGWVRVGSITGL
jgi:hypothetical protein